VPTLAERKRDLRNLGRFVREHTDAICEAISADYGHRSRHETLLTEVVPVLALDGGAKAPEALQQRRFDGARRAWCSAWRRRRTSRTSC
jgi:hypothetical protein